MFEKSLDTAFHYRQRAFQNIQCVIQLLPLDRQRRRKRNEAALGCLETEPALQTGIHQPVGLGDGALLAAAVFDQIDAQHQTHAAHIADQRMIVLHIAKAFERISAQLGRPLAQPCPRQELERIHLDGVGSEGEDVAQGAEGRLVALAGQVPRDAPPLAEAEFAMAGFRSDASLPLVWGEKKTSPR